MGSFPCRDSSDYGWAYNARYFHSRILGDHSCHVGATWLQQIVSFGSVYFNESICRLASPSRSWVHLLVLWLVDYLGHLFWRLSRLWPPPLIGSVCFGIYPYQLPPHSTGPLPSILNRHMGWQLHPILGNYVLIDRVIKSHKFWGDIWHNFNGGLLESKRCFVFHAISSIYMLLSSTISTFCY